MDCTCDICKAMCKHPCWPTPEETEKLIESGYGARLMVDYWVRDPDIEIVCPAANGYEGEHAPNSPWRYGCTFYKEGLCEIHNLKPHEGRLADCKKEQPTLHKDTAFLWDTPKGKEVVTAWKEKFYERSSTVGT